MGTHRNDGPSAQGLVTPTSDKAGGANVGRVAADRGIESPDSGPTNEARKAVTTMMAKAAQAGCTLHELAGGGYLLCRWGLHRALPTIADVRELLQRIGSAR